jgi:hypothetical protein
MRAGRLLEKLINIAQIPKTDFAIYMDMTPSGLSKILTGKRLPFFKDKILFSRQSANYFAEAIYGHDCHMKFEKIFPVVYDFSSKYELEMFLMQAVDFALGKDFAAGNNEYYEYPDKELSFLGKKTVLNMFCIIISDYIINDHNIPLEFYSTLPVFSRAYSDIFKRIKIIVSNKSPNAFLNHYVNISLLESAYDDYHINLLSTLVQMEQYADLNLWQITKEIDHSFLLLKGQFLLLFSIQLDGTPLMTFITHKSYITSFFTSLMKKDAKKISYSKEDAIAAFEDNPLFLDRLINGRINAVYNFISLGYLIKKEDLEKVKCKENIKKALLKLFNNILTDKTIFFVTLDAMMGFYATGKAIVPLIGAVDIAPDKRVPYLQRFDSYINEESSHKVRIVNSEMPKVAVLCSYRFSIVYLIDNEYTSEKFHIFETNAINNILESEVAENAMMMEFSSDLWATYIDKLKKSPI